MTIKSGKIYYGYKTHINIEHKLIRPYRVTAANSGDKPQLNTLLEAVPHNAREVWADGAYFSEKQEQHLKDSAYRSHIINRSRRPQYSYFRYGFDLIREALLNSWRQLTPFRKVVSH